ncbi:uncharacterized protein C10orf95-like [Columba livia]|uniref:uncharacterized protein C10orf95-like n=1 Tax=Columba livia TaxID=8932 RepID=UPI0031BBA9E4
MLLLRAAGGRAVTPGGVWVRAPSFERGWAGAARRAGAGPGRVGSGRVWPVACGALPRVVPSRPPASGQRGPRVRSQRSHRRSVRGRPRPRDGEAGSPSPPPPPYLQRRPPPRLRPSSRRRRSLTRQEKRLRPRPLRAAARPGQAAAKRVGGAESGRGAARQRGRSRAGKGGRPPRVPQRACVRGRAASVGPLRPREGQCPGRTFWGGERGYRRAARCRAAWGAVRRDPSGPGCREPDTAAESRCAALHAVLRLNVSVAPVQRDPAPVHSTGGSQVGFTDHSACPPSGSVPGENQGCLPMLWWGQLMRPNPPVQLGCCWQGCVTTAHGSHRLGTIPCSRKKSSVLLRTKLFPVLRDRARHVSSSSFLLT